LIICRETTSAIQQEFPHGTYTTYCTYYTTYYGTVRTCYYSTEACDDARRAPIYRLMTSYCTSYDNSTTYSTVRNTSVPSTKQAHPLDSSLLYYCSKKEELARSHCHHCLGGHLPNYSTVRLRLRTVES
jgi:hypothetical protein